MNRWKRSANGDAETGTIWAMHIAAEKFEADSSAIGWTWFGLRKYSYQPNESVETELQGQEPCKCSESFGQELCESGLRWTKPNRDPCVEHVCTAIIQQGRWFRKGAIECICECNWTWDTTETESRPEIWHANPKGNLIVASKYRLPLIMFFEHAIGTILSKILIFVVIFRRARACTTLVQVHLWSVAMVRVFAVYWMCQPIRRKCRWTNALRNQWLSVTQFFFSLAITWTSFFHTTDDSFCIVSRQTNKSIIYKKLSKQIEFKLNSALEPIEQLSILFRLVIRID